MSGRAAWFLLLVLGGVLVVTALLASPGERPPIYGLESNGLAVAESIAFDRDIALSAVDLERFEARHGRPPEGLHLELSRRGAGAVFAQNWFWGFLAAPWVALSPVRGGAVFNALLFLGAVAVAARRLRWRLGDGAVALVLVVFFFSWLPAFVFVSHSALLMFAATVWALGLVSRRENPARSQIPEVYGEESRPGPRRSALDLIAGALAAVPLTLHPVYLCVLLGIVMIVPSRDRPRRGAVILGGAMMVFAALAVVRVQVGLDATPWYREIVVVDSATGFSVDEPTGLPAGPLAAGRISLEEVEPLASDLKTSGWSAVDALVGRSVGWLPYFLPCLLLLVGWHRGERSGLAFAALFGMALMVVLMPFDFAGYAATAGNWAGLPFYALLLFVPSQLPGRVVQVATALVAAIVLWPLWLDPYSVRPNAGRTNRFVAPGIDRYLPVETTLRDVSRAALNDASKVLRVEPITRSLRVIGGRDLEWNRTLGAAGLVVAAPEGVDKIFLDFDKNGGTTLDLDGGRVVETLFRPSGRIGVVVALDGGRSHRTAASSEPTSFYTLRFEMEDAASEVIRFRCSADTVGG